MAEQAYHFEAEYQELLLPERYLDFVEPRDNQPAIEGYYYPVRLNDTYGLLIDASVDDQEKPQDIKCFTELRDVILHRLGEHPPVLGQTWMLSGWRSAIAYPSPQSKESDEAIAQAIYAQFVPEGQWQQDLEGQGTIFGATVFELWRYPSALIERQGDHRPTNGQGNQHLVTCIFPDGATAAQAIEALWHRLSHHR